MSARPSGGGPAVTTKTFKAMKDARRPIVMLTAYDAPSARLADEAGVDALLVGDSLGMTVLGRDNTLSVTMEDMVRHTEAVARAVTRPLVVADMPFMSYQVSIDDALRNAGRLVADGGAAAVKLEGGAEMGPTVRRLVETGIPVMGHVGLTPQSVHALGGYRTQATDANSAMALLDDCLALEASGAFAVVLECIPAELATVVSARLAIPTIGIGAGVGCDGQVQVFHDILGLAGDFRPRHAKRYAEIGDAVRTAIAVYTSEVRDREFPGPEHSAHAEGGLVEEVGGSSAARHGRP